MKKYILKPGKHQFAPGEAAVHNNEHLSDAEAEWYLERYPHIRSLFIENQEVGKTESPKVKDKKKRKRIGGIIQSSVKSQENENLPSTN